MKTFSDLKFKPHSIARKNPKSIDCAGAEIAKLEFGGNGRAISAIRGSSRFQCGPSTYEVAIYESRKIVEVLGRQTSAEITEIMKGLQS